MLVSAPLLQASDKSSAQARAHLLLRPVATTNMVRITQQEVCVCSGGGEESDGSVKGNWLQAREVPSQVVLTPRGKKPFAVKAPK